MNATASALVARGQSEEDEISRALTRSAVYRVLAFALSYPSALTIGAVTESAERAVPAVAPSVADGLRGLAAVARASAPDEVATAYVAALERPAGCSPYEGSYGVAPLLAGKGALLADIAGFYAAFGMAPAERAAEVEDHIAVELEFMSVLALKEAAALAEGTTENVEVTRAAESAFLRDHLGQWATVFGQALHATARAAYLEKAADLLIVWLAADCSMLGVEVGQLKIGQTENPEDAQPFACPTVVAATGACDTMAKPTAERGDSWRDD